MGRFCRLFFDETRSRSLTIKNVLKMPKLFVSLVLVAVFTICALALANATMSQYLSAAISLAALLVSVVSAFKEDVFPFRPVAAVDEIILAPTTLPSHDSLALVVPITFVNTGYGAGLIEGLTIKVQGATGVKVYAPLAEVDFQKYISGKRALHADNIIGTFNVFRLGARESVKKYVLFSQQENSTRYPFNAWTPGSHEFVLYAKHSASAHPTVLASINYEISANVLSSYKSGVGASLCPDRELAV